MDEALALLIAGRTRSDHALGLGSALSSAVRKVVDTMPNRHAKAGDGRPAPPDRTGCRPRDPAPRRGRRTAGALVLFGAPCWPTQGAHPLRSLRPRRPWRTVDPRRPGRGARPGLPVGAPGMARTAPTGCRASWPPRNSPNQPTARTGSTSTGCGVTAARSTCPRSTTSPRSCGSPPRGRTTSPEPPSAVRAGEPDPDGRLPGRGHVPGPAARRVGDVAARRGRRRPGSRSPACLRA
jgi:hypothetical protein